MFLRKTFWFVLTLGACFAPFLALPTFAAERPASKNAARVLNAPPPTATRAPHSAVSATTRGRCEVPVLWRDFGEMPFQKKCGAGQRERGTLDLIPTLGKADVMQLLIEWRIVTDTKIKFRCTGFVTYSFADTLKNHVYRIRTKPGQNLYAARLYLTPRGWDALDANTQSACQ